ncbi:MAG: Rrf2 family transcriptional regulator [Candidatus Omnitrophica bacterium]|nr:Rrf2 family transcriptional regulator [Candidatus Omnitrophota bacterium]
MKLITRDTDYALRAVCFIEKNSNKLVTVPELVQAIRIPRPFLRKILQTLTKKRILKSYKGAGGGFELALPPNKISLIALIKIFQGSLKLNECFLRKKACPNQKTCALKKKIDKIEGLVVRELSSITIGSLLKGE